MSDQQLLPKSINMLWYTILYGYYGIYMLRLLNCRKDMVTQKCFIPLVINGAGQPYPTDLLMEMIFQTREYSMTINYSPPSDKEIIVHTSHVFPGQRMPTEAHQLPCTNN
ncbi:hypothetical protein TNCV_2291661 [Trichonephila clavipes]|uniref:Uncharacterized protein n=1 Tax=Trichonephila clavipes TaxID=2585209 RepID=A0A8X6RJU0_TRICX|nr:hypothetical protein TNCV_2291661 [Trichonephila clavipes]